jgi:hypothetical protein
MVSRGLDVEDFQAMLPSLPEGQRLANAYYTNCAYVSIHSLVYANFDVAGKTQTLTRLARSRPITDVRAATKRRIRQVPLSSI